MRCTCMREGRGSRGRVYEGAGNKARVEHTTQYRKYSARTQIKVEMQ